MHADGKSTLASVSKWNSGKVNCVYHLDPDAVECYLVLSSLGHECFTFLCAGNPKILTYSSDLMGHTMIYIKRNRPDSYIVFFNP